MKIESGLFDEDIKQPSTTETGEKKSYKLIEPGFHRMMVAEVIDKRSKKYGEYICVVFRLTERPYDKRKVWKNFFLYHPSNKAKKYARWKLGLLRSATGIKKEDFTDTQQLTNKIVYGHVIIEDAQNGYPQKEDVDDFESLSEHENKSELPQSEQDRVVSFDDDDIPF
jgi:hypothetical protein